MIRKLYYCYGFSLETFVHRSRARVALYANNDQKIKLKRNLLKVDLWRQEELTNRCED